MEKIKPIIEALTTDPYAGVQIKNTITNRKLSAFKTLADIKRLGFTGLIPYLNYLVREGNKNLQVQLRRKNGTSSKEVPNHTITIGKISVANVAKDTTATPVESGVAPLVSNPQPIQPLNPNLTMHTTGLNGGLNQASIEYGRQLAKSEQSEVYKADLQTAKQGLEQSNSTIIELKMRILSLENDLKSKDRDIDSLKRDHDRELEKAKRPLVSDSSAQVIDKLTPVIQGFIGNIVSSSPQGINGPAQQIEKLSDTKKSLIEVIKTPDFNDNLCLLYYQLLEKTTSEEFVKKLQELANN